MDLNHVRGMKAAIDIGTNTVLLLIAEVEENGTIHPIHEEHRVPRLGRGVDAEKNINEAATQRVMDALIEYRNLLSADFPDVKEVIVTATSAVRDAGNREEFMNRIKEETGFGITLLSGREEAECTAAGALSVLKTDDLGHSLILDIGGGSTEVAQLRNGKVEDGYSYDMGSVRYTERFLHQDPPLREEINLCRTEIRSMFQSRLFKADAHTNAVGVAGTVTTLAGMSLELKAYEPEKLNGFEISLKSTKKYITAFSENTHQEMLVKNPVYLKGREDIFLAGLLILEGFMERFDLKSIRVSTGGIRHGALITL